MTLTEQMDALTGRLGDVTIFRLSLNGMWAVTHQSMHSRLGYSEDLEQAVDRAYRQIFPTLMSEEMDC